MSHSEKQRSAEAVGGKTARACDSCLRQRARWYCAADDAFLCQGCDSSFHFANPLALRHQRLRLQSSSNISKTEDSVPTWHRGFKRKARTPRPHHHHHASKPATAGTVPPFVPELETSAEEEEEEQLLYRVPIFDPVLAEFYSLPLLEDSNSEAKPAVQLPDNTTTSNTKTNNSNDRLSEFIPSDMELAEFAADMESLLGRGLDNDSFFMEELGLGDTNCSLGESGRVKEELQDDMAAAACGGMDLDEEIDLSKETLDIDFDCGSPTTGEEAEEEETLEGREGMGTGVYQPEKRIGLRLDYDAIIAAWSVNGSSSPWTNGERPQFGPDDCRLDNMGMWVGGEVPGFVQEEMGGGNVNERREARVLRYREKRRTRLFSKKIRYEVRKLNAEKRPRMKGRFVKRASTAAATADLSFLC